MYVLALLHMCSFCGPLIGPVIYPRLLLAMDFPSQAAHLALLCITSQGVYI
jgi:hypothetical protein